MRHLPATLALAAALVAPAAGSEFGDEVKQHLYDGTLSAMGRQIAPACEAGDAEACFAFGLYDLITAYEDLAHALYRHGATAPNSPALAMLFGTVPDTPPGPANPDPEPLTYEDLRITLGDFVETLGHAREHFETAGEGDAFVMPIDPTRVRIDLDGNGTAEPNETLALVINSLGEVSGLPIAAEAPSGGKKGKKSKPSATQDAGIGFDNADAIWFAGYSTVVSVPTDWLLAHDFSEFFDAYMHRIFPKAGLPMQDYSRGGTLFMDPDTDTFAADLIAAIHTADFPVIDSDRHAAVPTRLKAITAYSRRNWELIMVETDDNRELVPSPTQTSLVPGVPVTLETVTVWRATLDTIDQVIDGELLLPHWRFRQGFDLSLYFSEATETDLVMLLAGQGAIAFLRDGPIADAESFAEANRVFGDDWPLFALWFN